MSVITGDSTSGFSEQALGFAAPGSDTRSANSPFVGCESTTGQYHNLPDIKPWGVVIPREVPEGAPIFVDSVRFAVTVNPWEFQIGDGVRIQGQSITGGGSFQLPPQTVTHLEDTLFFHLSDAQALELDDQKLDVIYVIERGGSAIPSASTFVTFAPALSQTGNIFIPAVVNGQLDVDKFAMGVDLIVPVVENLRPHNAISFLWRSDAQGGPNAVNWRDTQRQLTINPGEPTRFHVQPPAFQPYRGERVFLYCSFYLGAGLVGGLTYGMGSRGIIEFELI